MQPVDAITTIESPPRVQEKEDLRNLQPFLDGLVEQLNDLIAQYGFAINELQLGFVLTTKFQVQFSAPLEPATGFVAYADGTSWDPGAGEGLYVYKSDNAWHLIA